MIAIPATSGSDLRWMLRYSASAFFFLVLVQCWSVGAQIPTYRTFFSFMAADFPWDTKLVLNYYWVACVIVMLPSFLSGAFLLLRSNAPIKQQRVAYAISAGALVVAFLWCDYTLNAMFKLVTMLSKAV